MTISFTLNREAVSVACDPIRRLSMGRYREAISHYEKYVSVSDRSTVALAFKGNALGMAGDKAEAKRILEELSARSKSEYVSAFEMALVHMGMGATDQALEWLEKAYLERSDWLVHINVTPIFDPVRSQSRLIELVKKMDLQ